MVRNNTGKLLVCAVLVVYLFEFSIARGGRKAVDSSGSASRGVSVETRSVQLVSRRPLHFEANQGQAGAQFDNNLFLNLRTDLVGSWSSGVWSRNSNTGAWTNLSTSGASQIAAADIDGDGIDDLVGVWPDSGLWIKYSSAANWQYISSAPTSLAVGDTNGDHKAEIIGIWHSVVWSHDGAVGGWTILTSGASQVDLGDTDGDGKDDLIGIWPGDGLWMKYTSTGSWTRVTSPASMITCGDLDGDGKSDLLGIWNGTVWAMNSATAGWSILTSGASQITAGDLDGDGKDDLIGIWADSGVWVKYSSNGAWFNLSTSVPQWITTARQPVSNAGCPVPNGLSIDHHGDITTNETWAGDGTVHKVSYDITIRPGATLTLAACAVVQVASGMSFDLRGDPGKPAKFVSAGAAGKPVLITNIPGGGNWGSLHCYWGNGSADLSYTTLENGGKLVDDAAILNFNGLVDPSIEVAPMVRADHLIVKNSVGTGIWLESGAGFTSDSTDITLTGCGGGGSNFPDAAIMITQLAAGTLPTLHVSGNAGDQIVIAYSPGLYISRDLTLKNLGVPYYFYFDRVRVTDPIGAFTPTLTIEPGVELRFDYYLMIGDRCDSCSMPNRPGRLLALGTAAQPILFTSSKATRAAGDWAGVWLKLAAGSRIENARIEFAGAWNGIISANCRPEGSNDHAGLFIGSFDDVYVPSPSDFANVTIANSASHGINAMWAAGTFGPDLTGAFTFQNINGCRQTKNSLAAPGSHCGTSGKGCLVP